MDTSIIKQLPASIEAEQALLGAIIVDPDSFDKVGGMISAEDFYVDEHKHIYTTLLKMYAQSKTIDVVTLVNALVEAGYRDESGSVQYVSLIASSTPSSANIKDYAKIVKDKSMLRHLIGICDEINEEELKSIEKLDDAIDYLCKVKGIGLKVASCALLFGFERLDPFPVDVWMKRVLDKYFEKDFAPTTFGRYAGVAQQYLFDYERNTAK